MDNLARPFARTWSRPLVSPWAGIAALLITRVTEDDLVRLTEDDLIRITEESD